MTPDPLTVTPETRIISAQETMQCHNIRHLPVVSNGTRVVGLLTRETMLRAVPWSADYLSALETQYILSKVSVGKVMTPNVITVTEDVAVEEAARIMVDHKVGCLPVLREGSLVGIITDTDIFKTFVEITGGGKAGTHIEARMPDQAGQLALFIKAISDVGSYIVSVVISYADDGYGHVDVKERGGDEAPNHREGPIDHAQPEQRIRRDLSRYCTRRQMHVVVERNPGDHVSDAVG